MLYRIVSNLIVDGNTKTTEVHVRSKQELRVWFAEAMSEAVMKGNSFTYYSVDNRPNILSFLQGGYIVVHVVH